MISKSLIVNGVKIECFEDGSVYLPASGANKAHRTFGANHSNDPSRGGYLCVKIRNRNYKVHRLICEAFHDNPNGYPEVDHIDRNRKNNRPDNLRWATRSINCRNTESSDKAKTRTGFNKFKNPAEYSLASSRLYEASHIRINVVNDKGKNSRLICSQEEYNILKPLKKAERLSKLKELRNNENRS